MFLQKVQVLSLVKHQYHLEDRRRHLFAMLYKHNAHLRVILNVQLEQPVDKLSCRSYC